MKIPTKKLKTGFEMPVFGLGTWRMAGDGNYDPTNDDSNDIEAIQRAINAGITHIDTAEMYASGHAEIIVGQAIKDFDRKNLFITSKVWPDHLIYEDVLTSCEASLKRLETDYLDLYLIHWPNPDVPLEETLKAFNQLKKEGLIKNIGVSNFNAQQSEEAQKYADIVNNQVHYSLTSREPDDQSALDYAQQNDLLLTAYRPLEKGILSQNWNDLISKLSEKYKKTPSQIAINWLISLPNVVTIAKMVKREHLEENLGAIGLEMEKEDLEKLSSL